MFSVPDELDLYGLSDQLNLTLADGTLVYRHGADDGPFEILIQPANVQPPAGWTNNRLPADVGGGKLE